jgi:L-aspartate oxidase
MDHPEFADLLVIGTGIAGCTCALEAAKRGLKVILISSAKDPHESNTYYAQGGIIYKGKEDSADLLLRDIIEAGAGLVNEEMASILAKEGPELVEKLLIDELRIPFATSEYGLDLAREGGHMISRIIHVDDMTGRAISERMLEVVGNHPDIILMSGHTAVDIITPSHHSSNPLDVYRDLEAVGAYVLCQETGRIEPLFARATVLATGGLGRIYLHTTNCSVARGDGYAMAARAGARLVNMEYVQFHPTALFHPEAKSFLISESVRGEGAVLVTKDGKTFMEKYHPMGSLAPRDVVSRAIYTEMLERGDECVYLDLSASGMSPDRIRSRFPYIYRTCLEYGIDITKDLVPVIPAAHYSCGGVLVDSVGRTNIKRLYAIGEVSCTGVHGANRLASTSLLECLLWGYRAAVDISRSEYDIPMYPIPDWEEEDGRVDPALIAQDWSTIRHTMWNYVGLIRSSERLEKALEDLTRLSEVIEKLYRHAKLTDELIGLRNGVQVALLVARAAWHNRTKRGCHYREG